MIPQRATRVGSGPTEEGTGNEAPPQTALPGSNGAPASATVITCDPGPDETLPTIPDEAAEKHTINKQVEALSDVIVIKSKDSLVGDIREDDCRREIAVEARIYAKLGDHPQLVGLRHWDPEAHTLTLEYMPHGNLEQYMKAHHAEISRSQRLLWAWQTVDALHLLHSAGVIHCDVGPHNMLLDSDLGIRISDFSGSSLEGSRPLVCPGPRYSAPDPNWKPGRPATVEEDLFALGTTIYFIATGGEPFEELSNDLVEEKYLAGEFPDLAGVVCGGVIAQCWRGEVSSALAVRELVGEILAAEGCFRFEGGEVK